MDTDKILTDLDVIKTELSVLITKSLMCGGIPGKLEEISGMIDKIKASITEA